MYHFKFQFLGTNPDRKTPVNVSIQIATEVDDIVKARKEAWDLLIDSGRYSSCLFFTVTSHDKV